MVYDFSISFKYLPFVKEVKNWRESFILKLLSYMINDSKNFKFSKAILGNVPLNASEFTWNLMSLEALYIIAGIFPTKLLWSKCRDCRLGRFVLNGIIFERWFCSSCKYVSDDMLRSLKEIGPLKLLYDNTRYSSW